MNSPALAHKYARQAIAEALAAAAAGAIATAVAPIAQAAGHLLDVMLAALETAQHELKGMNTLAEKIAAKRERYLPQFEQFIADYMAAGEVYANPVLVWFTLWLFDVRDIERALHFADICHTQNQAMPENWKRDMRTVAADEVFDWAEHCQKNQQSAEPYFGDVLALVLSGEWRVHEDVQAKFAKLAGDMAVADGNLQAAIGFWQTVQRITGGDGGVKTRMEKAEKALAKAGEGTPQ